MTDVTVSGVIENSSGVRAEVTTRRALVTTTPPSGLTAFGEQLVGNLSAVISLQYPYNLNTELVTVRDNQSGSSSVVTSMAQLTTGAAANSSSTLESKTLIKYQPGLGVRARFTAMYTTGVANSTQIAGIGDSGEGFFFGYNGTDFGILRRYGGVPEIRTLTVSTASSDAENITITLDGDANASVAVTASGVITTTANEIAAANYSDTGRGWDAVAVGDTVVFTSWNSASRTGTYSLSGATSAAGTFAQTLAGDAPTDSWVAQTSWNGFDKFDGTGITKTTLDPTKINVFQITFQYLGAGAIQFFIEDPTTGDFHLVHTLSYANANTRPSIDNPSIPFFLSTENTANTSAMVLSSASAGVFIEGENTNTGVQRGFEATLALGATSAETPIATMRVKEVFQGKINRTKVKLNFVALAVEHTKPCAINAYRNSVLTGASFSDLDTATSTVQLDTSATAFSGGVILFSVPLGRTGNQIVDISNNLIAGLFDPGETLTFTLAPTSGNAAEGVIGVNFTEKL